MNINQLQPASALAGRLGVKALVYGDPGTGKTPTLNTAPRPVLCAVEPGLLSMSTSNVPTWEAYTPGRALEFFDWIFNSAEANNFDTVGIDSVSQFAELVLQDALRRNKNKLAAFGDMANTVYERLQGLYFMPRKHVYLIAKKTKYDDGGITRHRPYFPGQDLNVKVPHLYDLIMHFEKVPDNTGRMVSVCRTSDNGLAMARDRSGRLAELEPPNLTHIFSRCMNLAQTAPATPARNP